MGGGEIGFLFFLFPEGISQHCFATATGVGFFVRCIYYLTLQERISVQWWPLQEITHFIIVFLGDKRSIHVYMNYSSLITHVIAIYLNRGSPTGISYNKIESPKPISSRQRRPM
jgi:hypothetical protein